MDVKSRLFKKQWLLIGLTCEFNSASRTLRKRSSFYDIVIIKENQNYRAFWNVCPHRNHPIVSSDASNADLSCPYHGWCFSSNGTLAAIPYEKECYKFSSKMRSGITLRPVSVELIGKLIFINLSSRPLPINRQFNKRLRDQILQISNLITHTRIVVQNRNFNWTLICENLRDGLHPVFLHQKTLMKAIRFSPPAIPKDVPIQFLRLRDGSYGGPDVPVVREFTYANRFSNPWPAKGRYHNYHLYPNVHIAGADGGYSFVIERFLPISNCETEVSIYYCLTENNLSGTEREALFDRLQADSFEVYEEDFAAMEKIQRLYAIGVRPSYIMGEYERMISRFQKINLSCNGFSWTWLRVFFLDLFKIPHFLISILRRR